ncbi:MAG: GAF domain-containing protein, partial [Nocardioidaceae bacterium]|nr:GAF domain-containing protein [Nocardioidaceae bacterium]
MLHEQTARALFPRCASAGTVADACEGIVDDLWEHGGLPSVYFLVDGRLRCLAARGYFQVVDGFRPGTGVIGRVVATGEAAVIDDLASTPHFIAAIPGLNAEACFPVTVRGQVVGAVNVESRGALPEGIADLLGRAATLLGAVIESAGGMPPVPL